MLKYFTLNTKKRQAEKHTKPTPAEAGPADAKWKEERHDDESIQSPVLSEEDENFLERIVSEEGPAPPLPIRPFLTPDISFSSEAGNSMNNSQVSTSKDIVDKGNMKENVSEKDKKSKRFSFLHRTKK